MDGKPWKLPKKVPPNKEWLTKLKEQDAGWNNLVQTILKKSKRDQTTITRLTNRIKKLESEVMELEDYNKS